MNTESRNITVSGFTVMLRASRSKTGTGPQGRVRVAAPLAVDDEAVRLAVVGKLGWIKRQRAKFQAQPRQSQRRNRLRVIEEGGALRLILRGKASMDLFVRLGTRLEKKHEILHAFYRAELKKLIPDLLDKWQPILGFTASAWSIKRMKTK
ncbi:putative metal-dependent hydrolase [Metapseudomonas resinovorans]